MANKKKNYDRPFELTADPDVELDGITEDPGTIGGWEIGTESEEPAVEEAEPFMVGDHVWVDFIYRSQDSDRRVKPLVSEGRIQRIDETAIHPYLVEGIGWTDGEYLKKM